MSFIVKNLLYITIISKQINSDFVPNGEPRKYPLTKRYFFIPFIGHRTAIDFKKILWYILCINSNQIFYGK